MIGWISVKYLVLYHLCLSTLYACVCGALVYSSGDFLGSLQQRVELNCTSDVDRSIDWEFMPHARDTWKWIFLSSTLTESEVGRYRVEENKGNSRLIIDVLNWTHAGRYMCTDNAGLGQSATMNITVFETISPCFSEPSFDSTQCPSICQLYYLGNYVTLLMNLSMYETDRSTTLHTVERPINAKSVNITIEKECANRRTTTQSAEIDSSSGRCGTCLLCIGFTPFATESFATDGTSQTTDNTMLNPTHKHQETVTSKSNFVGGVQCLVHFEILIPSIVLSLIVVIALCVYIAYLRRIITNLNTPLACPIEDPSVDRIDESRSQSNMHVTNNLYSYEEIEKEGDIRQLANTDVGKTYAPLSIREIKGPSIYDRLRKSPENQAEISGEEIEQRPEASVRGNSRGAPEKDTYPYLQLEQ